jgi:glutaminase
LSRFAGRRLKMNTGIYESEASSNQRNLSLAWLLDTYARMYSDPVQATDLYTRQCSLNVTAIDLAVMGATLANGGVNPLSKEHVIDAAVSRRVLAVMATAGLYESSGDWLFDCDLTGQRRNGHIRSPAGRCGE